jgi:glycosyltransferase involved in cell wall biosynthesis
VVVSRPFCRPGAGGMARLDAWLLRAVDCVVVTGAEEAERCIDFGLPRSKIRTVRPGISPVAEGARPGQLEGTQSGVRYIACAGPIESHKNLRMAVWAFGVLDYLYNDLHLMLVGTGPEEARLRKFATDVGVDRLVHFLGDRANLGEYFAAAEAVWVLGSRGGTGSILTAMAAGRPAIAVRTPETAALLGDGETGCLIAPNDPADLARQTRALLNDPERCRRLGEAGRRRIDRDFSVASMVRDQECVYDEVMPNPPTVRAVAG